MEKGLAQKPIEPPIGDFIVENANATELADGYYYHYSEVCKLLKLQAKRMFSKEDIINALHSVELKDNKNYSKIWEGMEEWFKQTNLQHDGKLGKIK
jgi:hypothetical protein